MRHAAIAAAIFATTTSPVAFAGTWSDFYAFAGGGASMYDRANRDERIIDSVILTNPAYASSQTNHEDMVLGGKAGAGWRFSKHFAVEIAYLNFGKHAFHTTTTGTLSSGRSAELKASAVAIGLAAIIPATEQVDFTVRAGVARWTAEFTAAGALQPLVATFQAQAGLGALEERGTDFTLGIGMGISLTERLALTIDVDALKSALASGPSIPFTAITAGAKYGF